MAKNPCTATAKSTGLPCQRPATPGAAVCRFHGGAAPQVRAKAQLRLVEGEVRELFGKIAPEAIPVDNPLQAYATFAGRVMAWLDLMDDKLSELKDSVERDAFGGEQIRATVVLYERAMDRANTVLASYARLGIDERLAKLSELQSKTVLRAIEAVIQQLGATPEQATQARSVAARHLRAVS